MGAQRGAETDDAAELPIRTPQVDMSEKPRDPAGVGRSAFHAKSEGCIVATAHTVGKAHREKRMARKYPTKIF